MIRKIRTEYEVTAKDEETAEDLAAGYDGHSLDVTELDEYCDDVEIHDTIVIEEPGPKTPFRQKETLPGFEAKE